MASLASAVSHAIVFLTKALRSYPQPTVARLHAVLDANLVAHYAPSWNVHDPVKGSGRRCMTLSPSCLPPQPIWGACTAANVQWFDWIKALGNKEFELFVDPGCVAIRIDGQIINVWQDTALPAIVEPARRQAKTLAQQIVEDDYAAEEEIFSLLSAAPSWMPPPFPVQPRSASPMSSISGHSRCSSRSSNSSSSGFSLASGDTSRTSMSSSSSKSQSENKQSRRERARCARVFIDASKNDVTPYDGGKTTVLTGGVMLGGPAKPSKTNKVATSAISNSNSWRSVRA